MNLLIVDDEYYNVESLRMKAESLCPYFDKIYCAYNLKHALEYFSQDEISIMICDIEMPGGSGLKLLEEIRARNLSTVCIFLTAHARFEYISRAMKLSSCDYLLKPVEDGQLVESVSKAVRQYEQQNQAQENMVYADYWRESNHLILEQFWQELFFHINTMDPDDITAELRHRKLDPSYADQFFILLVLQFNFTAKEEENRSIYEFAMKNIAREYFYREGEAPVLIQAAQNYYVLPLPADGRSQADVIARCHSALEEVIPYFPYTFNFYTADQAYTVRDIRIPYATIQKEITENISLENHIFDLSKPSPFFADISSGLQKQTLDFPEQAWGDLLLQKKSSELQTSACLWLDQVKALKTARRDNLSNFYYSFLKIIFNAIEKENPDIIHKFQDELTNLSAKIPQPALSFETLKSWITQILTIYQDCVLKVSEQAGAVTTVKEYIIAHLGDELNRDTLAAMVYLTPDYLSHIFKDETGMSLTNYIIEERIRTAKQLLAKNEMSIRDIAIACGFQNISYFSRQFKKSTGMTPREFRT